MLDHARQLQQLENKCMKLSEENLHSWKLEELSLRNEIKNITNERNNLKEQQKEIIAKNKNLQKELEEEIIVRYFLINLYDG